MESHQELEEQFGQIYGRRREWREYNTAEIAIRTSHNRRKFSTRAGVIIAFALAMVVYPIVGTLGPTEDDAAALPGKLRPSGESAIAAILGTPPPLASADLPLPSVDDTAKSIAINTKFIVSSASSGLRRLGELGGHQRQPDARQPLYAVGRHGIRCAPTLRSRSQS